MSLMQGAKYRWQLPQHDQSQIIGKATSYNISVPIMQVLSSRGFISDEQINSYLFSSFEKDVSHPGLMKDAQKAVDRIIAAINNKEKILICGDYDVDGITSSAMMMACLLPLGANINFFLPHRIKDGYGLSVKTVTRAAASGYKVLITVDNGITAFDPALEAKKLGIDLIVTDHHRPHDHLPDAYAVIDPHQLDCPYPYKKFAGVGVSFKILSLLYEKLGKELPQKVYELLLLGTVADVVPLTGENRFWVRHGLQLVNKVDSLSLCVLKNNARVDKPAISSIDIGFFIAPQINALGRLQDARQGVKFLLGTDRTEVEHIGLVLKDLNESRKGFEKVVLKSIEEQILSKKIDLETERIILASSDDWPPGVIGLVASRLVGLYNRPVLLFHSSGQLAKGSCRSISDFNMFEALQENSDILTSFGGHAAAAGLSLPKEKLPQLKLRLEESIAKKIPVFEPKPLLSLDAEITLGEVNKKLIDDMAYLEPFGNENPQPNFLLKDVTLLGSAEILKDAHVKCEVFKDGVIKPVIFFNRPEVYDQLLALNNQSFNLAVNATANHWHGRTTAQLQAIDISIG